MLDGLTHNNNNPNKKKPSVKIGGVVVVVVVVVGPLHKSSFGVFNTLTITQTLRSGHAHYPQGK